MLSYILHVLKLFITSLISTVLIFPISFLDTYFVATFNKFNLIITLILIVVFDTFNGVFIYKFSYWLTPKIIKKEKTKLKFERAGKRLERLGWWALFLGAATPLPYSLTIYAAGVTKWGNKYKLATVLFFGRAVKYTSLAAITYYGIKLF